METKEKRDGEKEKAIKTETRVHNVDTTHQKVSFCFLGFDCEEMR